MTPLKQLFRQPVRLFAVFLLVGMASAFICLSAGVFASAKATLAQIEERYVTIGVPTTETADVATEYNGLTLHHKESVISQDMWAYMDQLAADGTVIKGAYQQKYISAYCPSIQSVTSGKEDGTYVPSLDSPYNRAIMIIRVTSVDKTILPESTEFVSVSVTASIENVVKMHPDYAVRSTLRLIIGCNSQEELDALDIRPGGRYLVFGSDYIDRDLELRTTLAGTRRCSVEDIDLSKISYDLTEAEKKTASPDFLPVAKYSSGEKTTILGQDMVDAIDSCTMSVSRWSSRRNSRRRIGCLRCIRCCTGAGFCFDRNGDFCAERCRCNECHTRLFRRRFPCCRWAWNGRRDGCTRRTRSRSCPIGYGTGCRESSEERS